MALLKSNPSEKNALHEQKPFNDTTLSHTQ